MGKIFYIMGKSASGKDKIYSRLAGNKELNLKKLILYTTRPVRDGEENGKQYYFTDEKKLQEFKTEGKVIEARAYNTVYGVWTYFTADDGQIDLKKGHYLGIGTLESYQKMRNYYGESNVIPVYIEVEDGERLIRAIKRDCAADFLQIRKIFPKRSFRRPGSAEDSKMMILMYVSEILLIL